MSDQTAVNDQIRDAVRQVSDLLGDEDEALRRPFVFQVMVQAVALAMQNAVAQQQQAYILRNATTSVAVRAILESDPREALEMAGKSLPGEDVVSTLGGLMGLLDELMKAYSGAGEATAPQPESQSTGAKKPTAGGKKS